MCLADIIQCNGDTYIRKILKSQRHLLDPTLNRCSHGDMYLTHHLDLWLTVRHGKSPLTCLPLNSLPMHQGWPSAGSNPTIDTATLKPSSNIHIICKQLYINS